MWLPLAPPGAPSVFVRRLCGLGGEACFCAQAAGIGGEAVSWRIGPSSFYAQAWRIQHFGPKADLKGIRTVLDATLFLCAGVAI